MDFVATTIPATKHYYGTEKVFLVAGDKLKVEIGDDNELSEEVPAGKKWETHVNVSIVETNA